MQKALMTDELLALARLSIMAFKKPLKYMDDTDAEVIARFKKRLLLSLLSRCASGSLSLKRSVRVSTNRCLNILNKVWTKAAERLSAFRETKANFNCP